MKLDVDLSKRGWKNLSSKKYLPGASKIKLVLCVIIWIFNLQYCTKYGWLNPCTCKLRIFSKLTNYAYLINLPDCLQWISLLWRHQSDKNWKTALLKKWEKKGLKRDHKNNLMDSTISCYYNYSEILTFRNSEIMWNKENLFISCFLEIIYEDSLNIVPFF